MYCRDCCSYLKIFFTVLLCRESYLRKTAESSTAVDVAKDEKEAERKYEAKGSICVLGIESSCDDTSAAVVNNSGRIIGEGHVSQSKIHLEAGGILPTLASNLHRKYLKTVVETSMNKSLLNFKDLDAIAVTVKPGLVMSLEAGLEYAKDLCTLYSKPMIPIHHMEAHALTARMIENVKFPFLVFLISGGHCILALAKSVDKFYSLGVTTDKAPGSTLDRIARRAKLRNLPQFRGLVSGAAIEKAAVTGDPTKFCFPSHIKQNEGKNCNFYFSPFIQVAASHIEKEEKNQILGPDEVIPNINDFCAAVLVAMAKHMCQRIETAYHYIDKKGLLKDNEKCLVMSGGVACNKFFQKAVKKLCNHYKYRMVVPPDKLCTDNGVMIAWNGIEKLRENLPVVQPRNLSSVTHLARCPFGEDISKDVKEMGKQMRFKFMKLDSSLF